MAARPRVPRCGVRQFTQLAVPMVVLGAHRAAPTDDERVVMQQALATIADAKYPRGWYF